MRALIRNDGETVKESDGVVGINWANGEPLTRPEWAGGPYTLIENYAEPEEMDGDGHDPVNEPPIETAEGAIVVNGKTLTKEELLRLLGD